MDEHEKRLLEIARKVSGDVEADHRDIFENLASIYGGDVATFVINTTRTYMTVALSSYAVIARSAEPEFMALNVRIAIDALMENVAIFLAMREPRIPAKECSEISDTLAKLCNRETERLWKTIDEARGS